MLAGQHLDLSKNGTGPKAEGCRGFYASECGSKQVGRTKANVAVSFLLGGYNLSHYLKVTADHTNTSVKPGPAGGGSTSVKPGRARGKELTFRSFSGFLYQYQEDSGVNLNRLLLLDKDRTI
jgi:hypothetical protein